MQRGTREAGVHLPDQPAYCTDPMPGVRPRLGEPVWGTQARWEVVRDNENKRIDWCADHNRQIAAGVGRAVP